MESPDLEDAKGLQHLLIILVHHLLAQNLKRFFVIEEVVYLRPLPLRPLRQVLSRDALNLVMMEDAGVSKAGGIGGINVEFAI